MSNPPVRPTNAFALTIGRSPGWRVQAVAAVLALVGLVALLGTSGCSAWVPGVQISWYTPPFDGPVEPELIEADSRVRIRTANFTPETAGRLTCAAGQSKAEHVLDFDSVADHEGNYTTFTLVPGEYEFEYLLPHTRELLYGEMKVFGPSSMRARDFIHRTHLLVDPTAGPLGGGHPSVLTEDDLRRAAAGDAVTKVVFVADLKAIDGRVAMIDQEIRRLQDEEGRLVGQEEIWAAKAAERRRNALYNGDYGDDTPGLHLSLYQLVVGPEAYHWKRFSEADDVLRTYQEKRTSLRLCVERLREERNALRAVLGSVKVLHRSGDLVIATPDMTRRYHDAAEEVTGFRRTLQGPEPGLDAPYWFSELAHTVHWPHIGSPAAIYPRLIETNNRMATEVKPIGELLLVMKIGSRKPYRLK